MQLTELSNIFLGEAAASVASMVATPLDDLQTFLPLNFPTIQ